MIPNVGLKANLENQVKELNVRIIDLETKSYASSSRPATLSRKTDSRIEEITSQLTGKGHAHRLSRDSKGIDFERQRAKLDEERKAYEAQLSTLRNAMDELVIKSGHFYELFADLNHAANSR